MLENWESKKIIVICLFHFRLFQRLIFVTNYCCICYKGKEENNYKVLKSRIIKDLINKRGHLLFPGDFLALGPRKLYHLPCTD